MPDLKHEDLKSAQVSGWAGYN